MKLIKEHTETVNYLIEEDKETGQKNYNLEGVFLQADIKNRNGRIYPVDVLDKEVKRYVKENVKKNRAYGELGHPDSPTINLDRVSHMIKELKLEGKKMRSKRLDLVVLNLLKELLIAPLQESHSIIKLMITSLYMPVMAKVLDQADLMLIYLTSLKTFWIHLHR